MTDERKELVARLEAAREEWYRLQREANEAMRHMQYVNDELVQHDRIAAKLYKGGY